MKDTTRNLFAGAAIIALFMVFYLIIMAIIWAVKGIDAVSTALDYSFYILVAVLIVAFLFAMILLVARIFHLATRNIIDFQASDDRGEIARMAMRNLGQGDKQAMQMASRMAIQMSKHRQLPAPQEVEPEYADYWPLPVEDEYGTN